jgi:hypothetical protein
MTSKYKVSITEIALDTKLQNCDIINNKLENKRKCLTLKSKYPNVLKTQENEFLIKKEILLENHIEKQKSRIKNILNNYNQGFAISDANKFNSILNNYHNIISESKLNNAKDYLSNPQNFNKNISSKKHSKDFGYYNITDTETKILNITKEYFHYDKAELIKMISDRDELIEYLKFKNYSLEKKLKDISIIKSKLEQELHCKFLVNEEKSSLQLNLNENQNDELHLKQNDVRNNIKGKCLFY